MGVGQMQRVLLLRTLPAYARLPPELIAVVAEYAQERYFPKGTFITREGAPVLAVHFIVRGRVEVRRRGRLLRDLGPRTVVGGVAMLAREPEGYDLVTTEDTITLEITAEDQHDIFEDHFPLLRNVLGGVAGEILSMRQGLDESAGFDQDFEEDCVCPTCPFDLVQRMAFLREAFYFTEGRFDAIADMAREAQEVRLESGVTLWKEGDPSTHSLMVLRGTIACTAEASSQRFRFGPGGGVGFLDGIAGIPRWYTPVTNTHVVGLRLETETFFDLLEDHFALSMDLLRSMSSGLLGLFEKAADLAEVSGPFRLAGSVQT
jgi:CRP-like cAMP-binding protein